MSRMAQDWHIVCRPSPIQEYAVCQPTGSDRRMHHDPEPSTSSGELRRPEMPNGGSQDLNVKRATIPCRDPAFLARAALLEVALLVPQATSNESLYAQSRCVSSLP